MDNAGGPWELPWPMRPALVAVVLFAVASLAATFARAEPSRAELEAAATGSGDPAAEALFSLAEIDERDFAFARALSHYEASYAKSPSSRYAQRAMNRASHLKTH